MTIADLYYRIALYLELNSGRNHDRRHDAWIARYASDLDLFDEYRCVRFTAGEAFVVPPGQGNDSWLVRTSGDNALPLETIRRWEVRQAQRHQTGS
jgi:hypothetical protein